MTSTVTQSADSVRAQFLSLPHIADRLRVEAAQKPDSPWMVSLDIDGTIIDYSAKMTDLMGETLTELVDSGAHVVLASGRSLLATRQIIDRLGLAGGWAVSSNGAVTSRLDPEMPGGYEVTDTIRFDPGPALRVLRDELPEALIAIEDVGRGHKLNGYFPPGELTGPHEIVSFEELCETPATRVAIRSPQHTREEFTAAVQRMGLQGVSYAIGWTSWMDINPEGVSKATALEPIRARLDVPHSATVAAGDGENDIEMLQWASVSGAMGQGSDDLHRAADLRLPSIDEDGLVPLLRLLIENS